MERVIRNGNLEARYGVDDFVNPESYCSTGWTEGRQKAHVLLDGGVVLAIVFDEYYKYSEQDAIDEAVDCGKLDRFRVADSELKDYLVAVDGEGNPEYEGISFLGNASEPFDIDSMVVWVVDAKKVFGEDVALMTHDRVMNRLQEMLDEAYAAYTNMSAYDMSAYAPDMMQQDIMERLRRYQIYENLRDARTLAWLQGRR